MLYSKLTGVVAYSGGQAALREGQPIDEDHPLAKERPDLFGEGNEVSSVPSPARVETAMADGPGGQRVTRPTRVPKSAVQ